MDWLGIFQRPRQGDAGVRQSVCGLFGLRAAELRGTGSTYAVGYGASRAHGTPPTITLPTPTEVFSANITNTTYAYLSMLNGRFLRQEVHGLGLFVPTISGFDANGKPAGTPVDLQSAGRDRQLLSPTGRTSI